jgi:UDP-N-acetylglucosamine transferase subunit ALG13
MIFVSVGTHPDSFERLIKHIDKIAPKIKEKIIIQKGYTSYTPKNCEYFDFTDNLDKYYAEARLALIQSATSLLEFCLKYQKKPVITIPRQAKFKEHINDHQVEFGVYFEKKAGIKCILDIDELTPEFIENYDKTPLMDKTNLIKLQGYYKKLFKELSETLK